MANWSAMRARLADLEVAVETGDVPGQLRAGGQLAALVADVAQQPGTRRVGPRDQGDVLGGDSYRTCDVILDLIGSHQVEAPPAGVPWDGTWVRMLVEYLKALLRR